MIGANDTISVKRLETTGSKQFYGSTPFLTGVEAYIEQVQPELQPMFNSNPAYVAYKIFVDFGNDIQINDRITDSSGKEYAVEGVQVFKNNEIPSHLEISANFKFE